MKFAQIIQRFKKPKKVSDSKYVYLSVLLNVRSIRMLTRDKMDRMLDASSYEECAKMLEECGYEDLSKAASTDIETELTRHRTALFDEISELVPQKSIVDAFRLKYDYHNVKTLIKAEGAGVDGLRLLSESGRVDTQTLITAFTEEQYDELPPKLAQGIDEAKGVLARTANPQLADIILDKIQFEEMLDFAWQLRSPFFDGYTRILIDCANLRTSVRTLRMGRKADFLQGAVIRGGTVDLTALLANDDTGDAIITAYGKVPHLNQAASLGAQALEGGSLAEFELACDNAATAYLMTAKTVGFGKEPVITFLASLEAEITSARMILTGRLQGLEPSLIRERLRDSYA